MSESKPSCGTCLHWTRPEERDDFRKPVKPRVVPYVHEGPGYDRYVELSDAAEKEADELDRTLGECEGIPFFLTPDTVTDPACTIIDGSGYYAGLYTASTFFCAIWALKETVS